MNESVTWILVADSSHAIVFSSADHLKTCEVVEEVEHPESRLRGRDIMTDDQGRTKPADRASLRRSAMTPRTTPQDVEIDRFGRRVAGLLRAGHAEHAFGRLVLVAPPEFLGRVRAALPTSVASMVSAEVTKNLVNVQRSKLLDRLRVVVGPRG